MAASSAHSKQVDDEDVEEERCWYLQSSPFPGRPASIYFPHKGEKPTAEFEKVTSSAKNANKNLYFRIGDSAVEYMCVKSAFKRAGFKQTSGDNFNCMWSRHLKPEEYAELNKYQKTNHFPGTWAIGRKDNLARNLARMRRNHGTDEYDFFPSSYLCPNDIGLLKSEMERAPNAMWIMKPPASACGRGIRLVQNIKHVEKECKDKKVLVQRYIDAPLLINDYKFDLRIYVCVTSFDPLRIYVFDDGLARFSTEPYSTSAKSLKNRFVHLTNYAVNKKSKHFVKPASETGDMTTSKWSLKAFKRYLAEQRPQDHEGIWQRVLDVIIKTIIAADSEVNTRMKRSFDERNTCFELFGFDVLLDAQYKPYVIEVNIMPSLSCSSPMDKAIKFRLLSDLYNLAGFFPYDRKKHTKDVEDAKEARILGKPEGARTFSVLNRMRNVNDLLNPSCRLDILTEEEIIILRELYEEENRARGFSRIFPTANTAKYHKLFDSQRYYNVLLQKWLEEGHSQTELMSPTIMSSAQAEAEREKSESAVPLRVPRLSSSVLGQPASPVASAASSRSTGTARARTVSAPRLASSSSLSARSSVSSLPSPTVFPGALVPSSLQTKMSLLSMGNSRRAWQATPTGMTSMAPERV